MAEQVESPDTTHQEKDGGKIEMVTNEDMEEDLPLSPDADVTQHIEVHVEIPAPVPVLPDDPGSVPQQSEPPRGGPVEPSQGSYPNFMEQFQQEYKPDENDDDMMDMDILSSQGFQPHSQALDLTVLASSPSPPPQHKTCNNFGDYLPMTQASGDTDLHCLYSLSGFDSVHGSTNGLGMSPFQYQSYSTSPVICKGNQPDVLHTPSPPCIGSPATSFEQSRSSIQTSENEASMVYSSGKDDVTTTGKMPQTMFSSNMFLRPPSNNAPQNMNQQAYFLLRPPALGMQLGRLPNQPFPFSPFVPPVRIGVPPSYPPCGVGSPQSMPGYTPPSSIGLMPALQTPISYFPQDCTGLLQPFNLNPTTGSSWKEGPSPNMCPLKVPNILPRFVPPNASGLYITPDSDTQKLIGAPAVYSAPKLNLPYHLRVNSTSLRPPCDVSITQTKPTEQTATKPMSVEVDVVDLTEEESMRPNHHALKRPTSDPSGGFTTSAHTPAPANEGMCSGRPPAHGGLLMVAPSGGMNQKHPGGYDPLTSLVEATTRGADSCPEPSANVGENNEKPTPSGILTRSTSSDSGSVELPDFKIGKVDLSVHRQRTYDIVQVQIGSFLYDIRGHPTIRHAKVKINFGKRILYYELELIKPISGYEQSTPFTCVELPFSTLAGLEGEGRFLKIKVDAIPYMFLGKRPDSTTSRMRAIIFNRNRPCDLTGGQIQTVPVHKLTLKAPNAKKILTHLTMFDERFCVMVRSCKIEDAATFPAGFQSNVVSSATAHESDFPDQVPQKKRRVKERGCSCKTGCRIEKCKCVLMRRKCDETCRCEKCTNPLGQLELWGFSLASLQADPCLMKNIFKRCNLGGFMKRQVMFPCCSHVVPFYLCIPGTVRCPNFTVCRRDYKYSWCNDCLCDEKVRPRNHCDLCDRCVGARDVHCKVCGQCFTPDSKRRCCPHCQWNNYARGIPPPRTPVDESGNLKRGTKTAWSSICRDFNIGPDLRPSSSDSRFSLGSDFRPPSIGSRISFGPDLRPPSVDSRFSLDSEIRPPSVESGLSLRPSVRPSSTESRVPLPGMEDLLGQHRYHTRLNSAMKNTEHILGTSTVAQSKPVLDMPSDLQGIWSTDNKLQSVPLAQQHTDNPHPEEELRKTLLNGETGLIGQPSVALGMKTKPVEELTSCHAEMANKVDIKAGGSMKPLHHLASSIAASDANIWSPILDADGFGDPMCTSSPLTLAENAEQVTTPSGAC